MLGRVVPGDASPAPKRRKVRKGTQSCWECKRRKIRCTFVDRTQQACDGCKSRQVMCVSQEFACEAEASNARTDRLNQIQHLVGQTATGIPGSVTDASTACYNPNGSKLGYKTSTSPKFRYEKSDNDICNALISAWPSQHDLDIITSIPVGTSVLFHGTVCMPYSTILKRDSEQPKDILQLPSPGSHPVLMARKLLMLGTFLQGVPPNAAKDLGELDSTLHEVMSRVVETASRLVTRNDDLLASLEGIECIMIESMYHNNAGGLHRAWVLNRRAMTMAQIMGLHTANLPPAKILDTKTRDRIDPQYMWFRLVISDRYLSLMLGLPQGAPDNTFATTTALRSCQSLDRMERIEAMVGGLILQRNREDLHNMERTHEIDKLLQDAAASVPAQWWLIPDIPALTGSETNGLHETLRLMIQFTHYHLLIQLHLPYMLQPSTDRRYDYSKITAVNASREILSRFLLFQGTDMIPAYCRGIDFLAFIASTVLCLAHIECRRQNHVEVGDREGTFRFIQHQRPGDRGLLERTWSITERMAETKDDAIRRRIAIVLQGLLDIEKSDPQDHFSQVSISPEMMMQEFPCRESAQGDGTALCIQVPYFGIIRIERSGEPNLDVSDRLLDGNSVHPTTSSKRISPAARLHSGVPVDLTCETASPCAEPVGGNEGFYPTASNEEGPYIDQIDINTYASVSELDDWALQGVDTALFDSLIRGSHSATGS